MLLGNFADTTFGHWSQKKDEYRPNGYLLDVTSGEAPGSIIPAHSGVFDIDNISTAEIEAWWLTFEPGGSFGQHTESTLVDPCDGLAGNASETGRSQTGERDRSLSPFTWTPMVALADVHDLDVAGKQHGDAPEQARSSAPGLSVVPYSSRSCPHPHETPRSPVSTLPRRDPPHSTEICAVPKNHRYDRCDQPLLAPSLCAQWPTSVDKGKGRAAECVPSVEPRTAGNTARQYQQTWAPWNCDPSLNLRTGNGAQGPGLSTQIVPSAGPQRSVKYSKEKQKETGKGEGRRKRIPQRYLPPGIDWPTTYGRFCAEMVKIYLYRPTGEAPSPETAYAATITFIKDDLYLSPLVAKQLGHRPCRDLEQYLNGVLNELRPRRSGQKRGCQYTLERVERELADGLVAVNDYSTLLENPSSDIDLVKAYGSEERDKQIRMERARRDAIRGSFERMTLFFKQPMPGYLWTRPQVLFYAITYLLFGAGVFGDGVFFTPKPQT